MKEKNWHKAAYALFFDKHSEIRDIADKIGVSRQTISKYLKTCAFYNIEKQYRHKQALERQSNYKSEWYRSRRCKPCKVIDSLKLEHYEAVRVLSYEQFFNE